MKNIIENSLLNFYNSNHIDYNRYTDKIELHYLKGLDFDSKIYKPNLEAVLEEWLKNFEEQDRQYYLNMFEHFIYYTQRNFEYRVYLLKEYIFKMLSEYSKEKVLIVFSESRKGYKSGGSEMLSAWWKVCNGEMKKSQLLEVYSNVKIEDVIDMEAIVFADDIVATGFTLKATIEDFFTRFPYNEFKHTKFYATGVIATKRGKKTICKLQKQGIDIVWIYNQDYLNQAFKGDYIFKADEVKKTENAILKYEEEIGKDDDEKSFVMGFAGSKLLVGFHYETPNNTLCTFWRYGKSHVPLFERNSNQKITLEEIRYRKKIMRENAYKAKTLEVRK